MRIFHLLITPTEAQLMVALSFLFLFFIGEAILLYTLKYNHTTRHTAPETGKSVFGTQAQGEHTSKICQIIHFLVIA